MKRLIPVQSEEDIFPEYRGTAIGRLIEYHNLNKPYPKYTSAEILIGMCMDNRKSLKIPDNFAFILRSGGGNLRYSEFKVSYAVSIGGVKAIALIAHNHCGMVNLAVKKEAFIDGLVDSGWERDFAVEHFNHFAPLFEIGNEIDFVLSEAARLRNRYPHILIAPLFYKIEDNQLYLVRENNKKEE
ncbi:carbonic anhydrase [Desulfitobacterium sp. Sab5]|uniref:carbonic anhydrase n=1 Tax=Desulfitobacterium nosdiversum TaxID=3375356 RepID=UPI003CEDC362